MGPGGHVADGCVSPWPVVVADNVGWYTDGVQDVPTW